MTRQPDPLRKSEILDALVDYAFEHGLSDLSLRPLADALNTSPRMLLYHFGSKEQLLVETVEASRQRQYAMLERWLADETASFDIVLRRFWVWVTSPDTRNYLRLFFEIFGLSVQERPGFEAFARTAVADPLAFFERGFLAATHDPREAARKTTLFVATFRGLLMDLLATGDTPRIDAAFEDLLESLLPAAASSPALGPR